MTDDELKIIREVDKKADDAIRELNHIQREINSLYDWFIDNEYKGKTEQEIITKWEICLVLSLNRDVSVVLSELNSIKSNLKQVSETA